MDRKTTFWRSAAVAWLLFSALAVGTAPAQEASVVSPAVRSVYRHIAALRFSEARQGMQGLRQGEAPLPLVYLLENYLDFLQAVLDDATTATDVFFQQAAKRADMVSRMDIHSPWTRYAEAEIRLQRAALLGRRGHYVSAAREVHRVWSLLEENRQRYPRFALNRKSWSVIVALMGALPDEFRWVAELMSGVKGSVTGGVRDLEALLSEGASETLLFEEEIRVAIAFLRLNLLDDHVGAWRVLQTPRWEPRHSPLAAYALAVVAMRSGRTDEAIHLLEASPEGSAYYPFWLRYYLLGTLKLNRLDTDADQPLRYFAQHFPGDSYRWEVCQKIAWHHLLQGNENGYQTWMARLRATKRPRTEQDQAAWYEAHHGPAPNPTLLRARLLFDGGYYQRAYETLQRSPMPPDDDLALEYAYRLGRVTHALERWNEAERYYQQTIERGARSPAYYACQSALQLGLIYEKQHRYAEAKAAYQTCLRLKPQLHRLSLHVKAKAGLARLKEKR